MKTITTLKYFIILLAIVASTRVFSQGAPPITNINGTVCVDDNAQFRVTTSCTISQWLASPGGVIQGASTNPVVFVKWSAATTNAWIQVSYTNCTTSFLLVTVNAKSTPTVGITVPTNICQPQLVTLTAQPTNVNGTPNYTWFIDGQQIGVTTTPSINYTVNGLNPALNPHTASVTVSAMSCSLPTTVSGSTNFTLKPSVGQVSISSPISSRCTGGGTTSFSASATDANTYTWSITPGAGTISSSGVVTWISTYSGTATITVIANGCTGSSTTASTTVVVAPFAIAVSGISERCKGAGNDTFGASADNVSSITFALEPSTAGSIVSGAAGYVTWNSAFFGTATVVITATGCNTSITHRQDVVVKLPAGPASKPVGELARCQGGGQSTFTATAVNNNAGYSWAILPTGVGGAGTIVNGGLDEFGLSKGVVTWNSGFTGQATITFTALGCGSNSNSVNVDVKAMPTVNLSPTGVVSAVPTTLTTTQSAAFTYQWYLNGTPVSGQNQSSLVVSAPGLYTVKVNHGICSITSPVPALVTAGEFTIFKDPSYIKERVAFVEKRPADGQLLTEADLGTLAIGYRSEVISYFDGLGRIMQKVSTKGSPGLLDVVQPFIYDNYNREAVTYLPYTGGVDGTFKESFIPKQVTTYPTSPQYLFYQTGGQIMNDTKPFGEILFEPSPLNRPSKNYGAGNLWSAGVNNKFVESNYLVNNSVDEKVIAWKLDAAKKPVRESVLLNYIEAGGYFSSKQLTVNVIVDEEGNAVREYINKLGQVVLKKVQVTTGTPALTSLTAWALTYYIYDGFGNVVYVFQPELSKKVHTGSDSYVVTDTDLNLFAFQYKYDKRGRVIEKQVPGGGLVYLVYDPRDRVVLTQDANQRSSSPQYWSFTKYDELNRPILTGIKDSTTSRPLMQQAVDNYYANMTGPTGTTWRKFGETFVGAAAPNNFHGYTNVSYPKRTTGSTINANDFLTATYYDNYTFRNDWTGFDYVTDGLTATVLTGTYSQAATVSANQKLRGQVLGTKVKVMDGGVRGGSTWLKSISYYDDLYRLTQTLSENQKGGKIKISNLYDFMGRLLKSKETTTTSVSSTDVSRRFIYDEAGRLVESWHKLGTGTEYRIAFNKYNELGQLIDKKLHSTTANATNALQSIDYRYNIRGWLTRINDSNLTIEDSDPKDYFGMNLAYNDGFVSGNFTIDKKMHNGDISAIRWSTGLGQGTIKEMGYNFSYDAMGRLLGANHKHSTAVNTWATGQFDENGISYDLNGNIQFLQRKGDKGALGVQIDNLTYNYGTTGNRLFFVRDNTMDANDRKQGFLDSNGGDNQDYTYDGNGNLTRDLNRGIGKDIADGSNKITYNFLNLPETVTKGGNAIRYTYDATGRKLSQVTSFGSITKQTDYIGGLQFENDALQFIQHPEGRIVMAETKLIGLHTGDATAAISAYNATLTPPAQTDKEKYVRATSTAAAAGGAVPRTGMFPVGGEFWVSPGQKYKIRLKGYRDQGTAASSSLAYLSIQLNNADFGWPGATVPLGAAAEAWIEQIITIPAGAPTPSSLKVGMVWNGVLAGEVMFMNEFEITNLTVSATPEYQYNLTDHLGNVRITFTTAPATTDQTLATMETVNEAVERSQYLYYDEAIKINSPLFDHTTNASSGGTIAVTGVNISPATLTLAPGQIGQLTRVVVPANATTQTVTWSSSNTSIATVNTTGAVTGVSAGTATITVTTTAGSFVASSIVTVAAAGGTPTILTQNGEFDSGTNNWELVDFTSGGGASISVVQGAGLSGANALRVDVVNTDNSGWMLQLVQPLTGRLEVGKTYRISFMVKAQSARNMDVSLFGNGNNINYFYSFGSLNLTTSPQTFSFDYTCNDAGVNSEPNFSLKFYLANGVVSDVWLDKIKVEDITAGGGTVNVTGVNVSPTTLSLAPGQVGQLTKAVLPSNATTQTVTWSSSNTSVATVNSSGAVTAVAAGTATITVTTTSGSFTASSVVTVTAPAGANLLQNGEFDSGTSNWEIVDFTPGGGSTISVVQGAGLSGTNALRVDIVNTDNSGWMLQLVQPLTFRLEVGKSYRISFMVKAQSARNMDVSLFGNGNNINYFYSFGSLNLTTSPQTFSFDYTCNDAGVNSEPNFSLKFYLANGVISDVWLDKIKVEDITAGGAGVPVTGITLAPTTVSLSAGQTSQLTKTIAPANATNQNVGWISSNNAVASVSPSGLLTAVGAGTATITATSINGGFTSQSTVTVTGGGGGNVPVTGLTLSTTTVTINTGQTSQLSRTIAPANATNQNVGWISSNTSVATVNASGLVTAVSVGTATITCTSIDGGFRATSSVTVNGTIASTYSTRLTGTANEKYGLARSLSVMPGDIITTEVFAKYLDTNTNNWTAALTNLMTSIAQGTAPAGTLVDGGAPGSIGGTTFPYIGTLIRTGDNGTGPKAYLNYLIFDRNYVYKTGGFKRLSATPKENGSDVAHERLVFEGAEKIVITEPGYVYIYLSNENDTPVEVYFDDFKVQHTKGAIISSQDYYPFGLTFNSFQRENSLVNRWKFQGQERIDDLGLNWDSFKWRNHQPDIGRFFNIDPLSEKYHYNSTYAFSENKVVAHVELEGLESKPAGKNDEDGKAKEEKPVQNQVNELNPIEKVFVLYFVLMEKVGSTAKEHNNEEQGTPSENFMEGVTTTAFFFNLYQGHVEAVKSAANGANYSNQSSTADDAVVPKVDLGTPVTSRVPGLRQQGYQLAKVNGANRATIRTTNFQWDADLSGRYHFNKITQSWVPTPHIKVSPRNLVAPNQPAYNTKNVEPVIMSQEQIRVVRKYILSMTK